MSVAVLLLATVLAAEGEAKPAPATEKPAAATPAASAAKPAAPAAKPAASAAKPAAETKSAAAASGKLAPAIATEMTESIVAVNKALGLESWPSHGGGTPCVDRGGQGITAKSVSAEDTRKCAMTALDNKFPELGKSYVLAIPMVALGPVTVIALGIGDSDGWGAYSCDPQRKCTPVKVGAPSKWGKRMVDRKAKACNEATTLWFPENQKACGAAATTTAAAPTK